LSGALAASGNKVRAFELATQAVDLARTGGDASLRVRALWEQARMAVLLYRLDDAERALVEAEAIPGASVILRFGLLATRASFSFFRGDLETASRMYEQIRSEHRSLGNTLAEQSAGINLAEIEHVRGQTQRAVVIARETLAAMRSGPSRKGHLLHNLAAYLAAVDDLPGAAAAACESIGIRGAQDPDDVYVAVAIEHLALVFALRGDLARAARLEGYADAAFERKGFAREFTETTTHNRLMTLLREGLAPDELARVMAEGPALAPEAAIALAVESQA
jgi:ATP/maltotriose-dependent transcriptional regulator MalT